MMDTILRCYHLKDERRSGWVLRAIREPESVSDHSWGTALLCMIYADEAGVAAGTAVQMAVIHDIAEAVTGDVATRVAEMNDPDVREAKAAREREAMGDLLGKSGEAASGTEDVRRLWLEYETVATTTARFVRDMNLIDMCIQAYLYERDGRYDPDAGSEHFPDFQGLDEFFATTRPRLRTVVGRRLFDEILDRYCRVDSVARRAGPRV